MSNPPDAMTARGIMARETPAGLMHYNSPELMPYDHIQLINQKLLAAIDGDIQRLMIFAPPRHGKSQLVSRYLPAWYMMNNPQRSVILASYEATFAESWGGQARDVVRDTGEELFGVRLLDGRKAPRSGWGLEVHDGHGNWKRGGGKMWAAGAGGPLTGKGASLLIIDDPLKNWQDAVSAAKKESIWGWYRTTFFTRKNPGKWAIILMMTRWSEDDLAGRLLEQQPEKWEVLSLPGINEAGEALCPELWPIEALNEEKTTLGPHWFSALYLQTPTARESAMFSRTRFRYFRDMGEWFELLGSADGRRRRILREDCMIYQTIDCAHGLRTRNDYTVVMTVAQTPGRELLVLDVMRARIEPAEQWPAISRLRESVPDLSFQAVEAQKAGLGLIAMSEAEGFPVRALKADRDKVTRATPLSVAYEAGKVFHLMDAAWLETFESELVGFPVAKHDDQVDSAAYAWLLLQGSPGEAAMVDCMPDGERVTSWEEDEAEAVEPDGLAADDDDDLAIASGDESGYEPRGRRWFER